MFGLFRKARASGVTNPVAPSSGAIAAMLADHDRALAERRAARPAEDDAHRRAVATSRTQRLARDPIWQNRDAYQRGRV